MKKIKFWSPYGRWIAFIVVVLYLTIWLIWIGPKNLFLGKYGKYRTNEWDKQENQSGDPKIIFGQLILLTSAALALSWTRLV